MANSVSHFLPIPIRNARYSLQLGFRVAAGTPTDPTSPDTEISSDGGASFADTTEEITTGGGNGLGYLTLTATEMDNVSIALASKSSNCLTTMAQVTPVNLVVLSSGTASAGAAGSLTLGTVLAYDIAGCYLRTTGGTGGGTVNNQARLITAYNSGTGVATVVPNWAVTPDNTTTYDVLLPPGVTAAMLKTLNPTVPGRTLDVTAAGNAGIDWGNVENPTTAVNLSATNIDVDQIVASVSGNVDGGVGGNLGGNVVGNVNGSVGSVAAGGIDANSFAPGAIDGTAIASNAIGSAQIATGAIDSTKFAAGAIDAAAIASNAITAAKIATGAITAAKFAAGAIDAAALATDAVAEIADGVWDEPIAGHLGAGSTGAALNAAGSAGDPWTTPLPGAYGAGTAGKIVGDNLNAAVGSVPTAVQNADALLGRNVAGGSSTGRLVKEALYAMRNRVDVSSGTTMDVYQTDDTTLSWQLAITTDAAALPIKEVG